MIDIQAALASLRTGEESVRRRVVEELGRSGRPEAILPLLMAVGDESWPVRQAAAELLAAFDDQALLPSLEAALRDHEDAALRNAAMEIWIKVGPAAGGALLRLLQDPDVNVRHAAAAGLGQIGDRRAVAPLMALLRGEPWLQYPAIHALAELGDPRAAA